MPSGDLNSPINHIKREDIPDAIDKLHEVGVVGQYLAQYDD